VSHVSYLNVNEDAHVHRQSQQTPADNNSRLKTATTRYQTAKQLVSPDLYLLLAERGNILDESQASFSQV
jgi:hypothetical protein